MSPTRYSEGDGEAAISLLRLLQLVSPGLPVGAYAYSRGQEWAVHAGWLNNEAQVADWVLGLLNHSLAYLDIPVLARLHEAWAKGDQPSVRYWNAFLFASRESAEIQAEESHMGRALVRLLADLDMEGARDWMAYSCVTYATAFSMAAAQWKIPLSQTCSGYAWAWAESQVAAAVKLVPLGQTAGQRILTRVVMAIPDAVNRGKNVCDNDIGYSNIGLACASALHEIQHTRLFRS